jgi:hypothetical protein
MSFNTTTLKILYKELEKEYDKHWQLYIFLGWFMLVLIVCQL